MGNEVDYAKGSCSLITMWWLLIKILEEEQAIKISGA
jgi:hypothetical protein